MKFVSKTVLLLCIKQDVILNVDSFVSSTKEGNKKRRKWRTGRSRRRGRGGGGGTVLCFKKVSLTHSFEAFLPLPDSFPEKEAGTTQIVLL